MSDYLLYIYFNKGLPNILYNIKTKIKTFSYIIMPVSRSERFIILLLLL